MTKREWIRALKDVENRALMAALLDNEPRARRLTALARDIQNLILAKYP